MRRADLDRSLQGDREGYWRLHAERARGHRVVVVEGDDDRDALELALGHIDPDWATIWYIVAAGGRDEVLKKVRAEPSWRGLVDRDVWTEDEADARALELGGRLVVTRGWCLENDLLAARATGMPPEQAVRDAAWHHAVQRARDEEGPWRSELLGVAKRRPWSDQATLRGLLPPPPAPADLDALCARAVARVLEVQTWTAERQWERGVNGKEVLKESLGGKARLEVLKSRMPGALERVRETWLAPLGLL